MLQPPLAALRRQHKQLFYVDLSPHTLLVRPLTRQEYEEIQLTHPEGDERSRAYCEACVVWPKINFQNPRLLAGLLDSLPPKLLELSGFTSPDLAMDLFQHERHKTASSFERQAECMIAVAFPHIRLDEIKQWSLYTLMEYYARAEWILKNLYNMEIDLEITHPEPVDEEEQVRSLREQGIDPMFVMPLPADPPFVAFPLITRARWNDQATLAWTRQQL